MRLYRQRVPPESSHAAVGVAASPLEQDLRDAYLDLLGKSLTHALYGHTAGLVERPLGFKKLIKQKLFDLMERRDMRLVRFHDPDERTEGTMWPLFGHTMLGLKRLENVRFCIDEILRNDVPGDLIETGVWRGGTTIFMRGVLKANGVTDRDVWVADSFEGMPRADGRYDVDADSTAHRITQVAVPLEEVQENFRRYGLLDDQVRFLKGWFKDTLPTVSDRRWAVVRLDGDMYQSTMDALTNLYENLSIGGYLIVDDYALEPCRLAIHDFREEHDITDEIRHIDWTGIFWKKGG
jgi:O-methyltransferase